MLATTCLVLSKYTTAVPARTGSGIPYSFKLLITNLGVFSTTSHFNCSLESIHSLEPFLNSAIVWGSIDL